MKKYKSNLLSNVQSTVVVCIACFTLVIWVVSLTFLPEESFFFTSKYQKTHPNASVLLMLMKDLIDFSSTLISIVILIRILFQSNWWKSNVPKLRKGLFSQDTDMKHRNKNIFIKNRSNKMMEEWLNILFRTNTWRQLCISVLLASAVVSVCFWNVSNGTIFFLGFWGLTDSSFSPTLTTSSVYVTVVIVRKELTVQATINGGASDTIPEQNLNLLLTSLAMQNADVLFDVIVVNCDLDSAHNSSQKMSPLSSYHKHDDHEDIVSGGFDCSRHNINICKSTIKWQYLESCPEPDQIAENGSYSRTSYMKTMGIKYANNLSQYILLLDDDLELMKPHFVQSMMDLYHRHSNDQHYSYHSAGAVGCKIIMAPLPNQRRTRNPFNNQNGGHGIILDGGSILWNDGSHQIYGYGRHPYQIRLQYDPHNDYDKVSGGDELSIADDLEYARPVDFVSGSCLLFSKENFYSVGGYSSNNRSKSSNDDKEILSLSKHWSSSLEDIDFQMKIRYILEKTVWFQPAAVAQRRQEQLPEPVADTQSVPHEGLKIALQARWAQELNSNHLRLSQNEAGNKSDYTVIKNFPKTWMQLKAMDIRSNEEILIRGFSDDDLDQTNKSSNVQREMTLYPSFSILYIVPFDEMDNSMSITVAPQVNLYKEHLLTLTKMGHKVTAIMTLPLWTKLDDEDFLAGCTFREMLRPSTSADPSLYLCGTVQRLRQYGIEVITTRTGPTVSVALLQMLLKRPCLYDVIVLPKQVIIGDVTILHEPVTRYLLHETNYPIITVHFQVLKTIISSTARNKKTVTTELEIYSNVSQALLRKSQIQKLKYHNQNMNSSKNMYEMEQNQMHYKVWDRALRAGYGSTQRTSLSTSSRRKLRTTERLTEDQLVFCDKNKLHDLIHTEVLQNRCEDLDSSYIRRYSRIDEELRLMTHNITASNGQTQKPLGLAHFYKSGVMKGYIYDELQEHLYLLTYPNVEKQITRTGESGPLSYRSGFHHFQQNCCTEIFMRNPNEMAKYIYSVYDEILYRDMNRDVHNAILETVEEVGKATLFSGWHHYKQYGIDEETRKYGCW